MNSRALLFLLFNLFIFLKAGVSRNGIRNLGNTCYFNSIIQSLYNSKEFREAVLSIDESLEKCTALFELRNLFIQISGTDTANARAFMEVCGLSTGTQEDAQELLLKVFEKIEEMAAGSSTETEKKANPLTHFTGEMVQYIKCKHVDVSKEKKDKFYDISIDIGKAADLNEALELHFTPDELKGENKYKTSEHGYQEATKGIYISKAPDVLYIHLKRFEYDFELDKLKKISKHFTFPVSLNLEKFVKADETFTSYDLNSIVLHDGSPDFGHYICFARPDPSTMPDTWLQLNDDIVSEISFEKVYRDSTGGAGTSSFSSQGSKNAYILQYTKKRVRK